MKQYLAFDIGGTETKYGLINERGEIQTSGKFSSQQSDGKHVLKEIKKLTRLNANDIDGLAISVPGFVDTVSGFIEYGGAFRAFDRFHMKSYLEDELEIPVSVENDVNCVAYSEKWLGNARSDTDFLCITIGTGIGGALFLNNQLYRGVFNRAGEFGYMVTQNKEDDILDDTLNHTSTMLVLRKKFAAAKNMPLNQVTGIKVFQAYDAGDEDANRIVTEFYESISRMIYSLSYIIDPGKILIGGGISNRPTFLQELHAQLGQYGINDDILEVDICYFKNHAGIVGSTYHHMQQKNN